MDEAVLLALLRYGFLAALYLFLFALIRALYRDLRVTAGGGYLAPGQQPCPQPPPAPYLEQVEGIAVAGGPVLPLDEHLVTFGRHPDNQVVLPSRLASAHHFRLQITGDQVQIEDLGSTNGTYLNEERLQEARLLQAGDRISAGDATFTFHPASRP